MPFTVSSDAGAPCRSASQQSPPPLSSSSPPSSSSATPLSGTPAPVALRAGDEVFHYREGDNPGIVVGVRRPWWALFGRVYWVQWRAGVLPVPMHTGLRLAPDDRQSRREATS
ncbi:hypothetical protein N7925_14605 [Streptomyces sp. CA-278952]|uniref:hypothetical protein n=1 Tax=unclassified Streptomyces TaxID=2593676 RepID=UPI0023679AC9|nr:hypothetical protein [Streptomyces sp. CA-278952]WDG29492.1 hypothetical protein N7925_14605 [Streptomyces sp. CA-278952]